MTMPDPSLKRIFGPRTVAVIGASPRPGKVGYTVLHNLKQSGFEGTLIAVNPRHEKVLNRHCFDDVMQVPQDIDLAVICTPAATVSGIVAQCGEAGVGGLVILTAGFQECGAAGAALQEEVRTTAGRYPHMRIIGPNCVGVVAARARLNASFARGMPAVGNVTFISQSGALCTAVLDWALQENLGFANFVSVGNMMDVQFGELIEYFAEDENTHALVLYVESIRNADRFLAAASHFTSRKPVIAYKAGRFRQSAAAAASHTGALAGEDSVYDAAFRRVGINRVYSMEEMFDCAEVLARSVRPPGDRLAIVTNAGGAGVMATDALIASKGTLASLGDATLERLNGFLPANWSRSNPVDVIGDAPPERLASAADVVLADPGVDALLVIVTPQALSDPTGAAFAIIETVKRTDKPVLASWIGGLSIGRSVELLNEHGIPTFDSPERAIHAFLHLIASERGRQRRGRLPDITEARHKVGGLATPVRRLVTEVDAKQLVAEYGIEVADTKLARSEAEAVQLAEQFGYPVVLKIASPEISHKSDIGGVKLDLADKDRVVKAYRQIVAAAREHAPQTILMGVSVQPMIRLDDGYELIAGSRRDPVFGPVIMVGAGGVHAEIFRDVSFELPPLNESLALEMLQNLRSWPLLEGFRGKPPLNVPGVVQALICLSRLVCDHAEIGEMDINPLLVTTDQVVALDARIVVAPQQQLQASLAKAGN
jgi:acetyltransferase